MIDTPLNVDQQTYLQAAVAGNLVAASHLVDTRLARGDSALSVYLDLLAIVQRRVGDLWERGELSVAEEHMVTEATQSQMDRLRPMLAPAQRHGARAVLAGADGDWHSMGARIVSDFLLADGWEVLYLGPSVPAVDLAAFATRHEAQLVGISLTVEEGLDGTLQAARVLKGLTRPPKVLVGGPAAVLHREEIEPRVDAVAADALEAVAVARGWRGAPVQREFEDYLALVGAHVRQLRQQHGWNQDRLAQTSGLDRTYISAVENGKQNLTIKALVALATALSVPAERLLRGND